MKSGIVAKGSEVTRHLRAVAGNKIVFAGSEQMLGIVPSARLAEAQDRIAHSGRMRLIDQFGFQAMYAGLSPFEALAIYCVITYMDTVEGVYFPEGGMHAIPRALAEVADPDIAKISLIGAGMKSSPGVAAAMFEALADAGVNIEMISTSTIRISCVIRATDVGVAVRAVHERFHLSEEAEFRHDHPDGTAELPVVR